MAPLDRGAAVIESRPEVQPRTARRATEPTRPPALIVDDQADGESTQDQELTQLGIVVGVARAPEQVAPTPMADAPTKPTTFTRWPATRPPAPTYVELADRVNHLEAQLADLQARLARSEAARADAQRSHADALADLCARDRRDQQASAILARAFDVAARAITGMSAVELTAHLVDPQSTSGGST